MSALVERDSERELIEGALRHSKLGGGRFVVLYGPAGMGRSSLLRASVLAAQQRGIAVVEAYGSELERGYGFGVVRQLLEAPIASLTVAQRRSVLRDAGPAAESALGFTPSERHQSSSAFEQIEGVYRLIVRLAAMKPLLVAVDDLQWCDRPSLDFLCFLGHRAGRLPVTIIAAWRRGEPGVRAGRLQALAGKPGTLFLTLAPLSRDGVRAVIAHECGVEPDDEAVGVVHARTGGQPRLVAELAAALRLRNLAPKTSHREAIEAVTPESVRRDLMARLGRHPEAVHRFAEAVAVLENGSLAEAAALAAMDHDKARDAAAALVRAGILRDDAVVAYAYPLLRAAAYDTLSSLEGAALHRRAAAMLCAGDDGTDPTDRFRLAEHLLRSEPAGDPRFAQALLEAARSAADAGRLTDAQRYLERALAEIEDTATRAGVLVQLAEVELRTGDLGSAGAHASDGLALASRPSQRVAASLISAQAVAATGTWAEAVEELESETTGVPDSDPDLELTVKAAVAALRVGGNAPPCNSQDEMEGFMRLRGESSPERTLLAACASHMTLIGAGSAAQIRDLCRRALRDREQPRGAGISGLAAYLAGRTALLVQAEELAELEFAREGDQDGAASDDRELSGCALRSQLALGQGNLAEAETHAGAALDLLDELPPTALGRRIRSDLLAGLVLTRIEQTRYDEAKEALTQLTGGGDAATAVGISLRIALALARSEPDEAVAWASELAAEPVGVAAPGITWRPWAALAYHAAGERNRALRLATAHVEHAREFGAPWLLGGALVVRGVVDPGHERIALIEEAIEVLEATSARLELARALIELGVALRRARRRREARVQLVRGADLAHRCDATALSARAHAELLAVGARPRRAAFSGVGSLTLSELRVARLAATGMTNREIARELVVSVKTVSGQLSAVYRKLDVHDRTALAAVMREVQASPEREVVLAVPDTERVY